MKYVWNFSDLVKVENDKMYLGYTNLDLNVKNDSSNFTIILHKESNGLSNQDATNRAENIEFHLDLADNRLMLSPYFIINAYDKFRGQIITIEIQVPLGKKVVFGDNVDRISVDVENDYYRYSQDYANTTWVVDEYNEMRCLECKDHKRIHEYNEFGDEIEETIDDITDDLDDAIEELENEIEEEID